jgi:hypothetical protein
MHVAAACAAPAFHIGEYFFDHARIEKMFFEGTAEPVRGELIPDRSRTGHGLVFKRAEAGRFSV